MAQLNSGFEARLLSPSLLARWYYFFVIHEPPQYSYVRIPGVLGWHLSLPVVRYCKLQGADNVFDKRAANACEPRTSHQHH